MRIKTLEVCHFRGLYGTFKIDLNEKNLMVYGENGSGKSSLCQALRSFLDASVNKLDFSTVENIFLEEEKRGTGYIKVQFNEGSPPIEINRDSQSVDNMAVADANKLRGFLDYKALLKTHFVDTETPDLFDLLINGILYHAINPFDSNQQLGAEWESMQASVQNQGRKARKTEYQWTQIQDRLQNWNDGVERVLKQIEPRVNAYIGEFKYGIHVRFKYTPAVYDGKRLFGQQIQLQVDFLNQTNLTTYHRFLNEARLTALAIAIYFASIKSLPSATPFKLLILDDVFIGLDMANRMPLLEILKRDFLRADVPFQVIMTTYDRQWYELVKLFEGQSEWVYLEMYAGEHHHGDIQAPIVKGNTDFIMIADRYVREGDYKAAAVYIRSEFERILKKFCDKHNLSVRYKIKLKKLTTEDFWKPASKFYMSQIESSKDKKQLCKAVERLRSLVLNPFSHYDLQSPYFKMELRYAMRTITTLRSELSNPKKKRG